MFNECELHFVAGYCRVVGDFLYLGTVFSHVVVDLKNESLNFIRQTFKYFMFLIKILIKSLYLITVSGTVLN